jgi:hypothetical protein
LLCLNAPIQSKTHRREVQYPFLSIVFGGIRRREIYHTIFLVSIGREISVSEELAASVPHLRARPLCCLLSMQAAVSSDPVTHASCDVLE